MLKKLSSQFLDILYPPQCFFCECNLRDGNSVCDSCLSGLLRVEQPFCMACGEPFDGVITESFSCPNCHQIEHDFDFAVAALRHSQQNRELVHALKYKRQRHLSRVMAMLMAERFELDSRFLGVDWIIVPTPLHWTRRFKRHFNQSLDLAEQLSLLLEIPCERWLKRVRKTQTQTRLNRKGRSANLSGAFSVSSGFPEGKTVNVILLDDVLTTGSTAHECAKTLKTKENVEKVVVLTLLRG